MDAFVSADCKRGQRAEIMCKFSSLNSVKEFRRFLGVNQLKLPKKGGFHFAVKAPELYTQQKRQKKCQIYFSTFFDNRRAASVSRPCVLEILSTLLKKRKGLNF